MVDNSVSVTAGSTAVVGNITSFSGGEWDMFSLVGLSVPVQSVEDTSHLTLKYPWPGPTLTDQVNWRLVPFGDASRTNVAVNQKVIELLNKISAGTLALIGNLKPEANKLPYFTDANTAALTTLTQKARDLLEDPDAAAMLATLGLSNVALKDVANVFSQLNTFEVGLTAKRSGVGGSALTMGDASNAGYVSFTRPDGVRLGYSGYGTLTGGMLVATDDPQTPVRLSVGGADKVHVSSTQVNIPVDIQQARSTTGIVEMACRAVGVGANVQARYTLSTNTPNGYGILGLLDNSGSPFLSLSTGSAVQYIRFDMRGALGYVMTPTEIYADVDNRSSVGIAVRRCTVVFATTGTINTSDAHEKANFKRIDPRYLLAALDTQLWAFQREDAIEQKGVDGARWHFGPVAQDFRDNCLARGVDPRAFAGYCEDKIFEKVKKTRKVRKPAMETVTIEDKFIVIEEGVPVQKVTHRQEQRPVTELKPVVDEQGHLVMTLVPDRDEETGEMIEQAQPLMHEVPVLEAEESDEEYDVEEWTGRMRLGLRPDQCDRLVQHARWLFLLGEIEWTPLPQNDPQQYKIAAE